MAASSDLSNVARTGSGAGNGADAHPSRTPERNRYARSFGAVAADYDRARPSYPTEAVAWLIGDASQRVLELGAGTGKLTDRLLDAGHDVLVTEPDGAMLRTLRQRHADLATAQGSAEQLPVASRSVDVVVAAQAAHWFDLNRVLPEAARVLRPGGRLSLTWNIMDTRIPWVRRLRQLVGSPAEVPPDVITSLEASEAFGDVEAETFRFWQPLDRESLAALVSSVSVVALSGDEQRAQILAQADALYDEYGRGPDGMLLPYLTHTYRASVVQTAVADEPTDPDPLGTDALLIDFR